MDLRVEVVGESEDAVMLRLRDIPPAARKAAAVAVRKSTILVTNYIKEDLLSGQVLQNRTGRLRRAVFFRFDGDLVGLVQVSPEAYYWRFHEFGVDHQWLIAPKEDGKVLHFVVGGADVFARVSIHPGLQERGFMRRGLRDKRDDVERVFHDEIAGGLRG